MIMNNVVHCCDCMDLMKDKPDKFYDLAIVDPPYGIGADIRNDFGKKRGKKAACISKNYIKVKWDNTIPEKKYFDELFRISKYQIIWGVNYYNHSNLKGGRIFWNKDIPANYTKSKGEIAFKSFGSGVDYIKITWNGMIQQNMKNKEKRIHPTQKPVALYKWLLQNYAKPGWKIFDSHVGSGSLRIACYDLGFWFEGCELDKDYWQAQEERFQNHIAQPEIFDKQEIQENIFQEQKIDL